VIKKAVTKSLHSVSGLAHEELESTEMQVGKITKAIQQLQAWTMELELQAVPITLKEVCHQREQVVRNVVERIRELPLECKKLSNRSA
jgi:hypothetical protein